VSEDDDAVALDMAPTQRFQSVLAVTGVVRGRSIVSRILGPSIRLEIVRVVLRILFEAKATVYDTSHSSKHPAVPSTIFPFEPFYAVANSR